MADLFQSSFSAQLSQQTALLFTASLKCVAMMASIVTYGAPAETIKTMLTLTRYIKQQQILKSMVC